jgi:FkbM family methyltransferase
MWILRLLQRSASFALSCQRIGVQAAVRLHRHGLSRNVSVVLADGYPFTLRRTAIDRGVFLSVFRDRQYPTFEGADIKTILDAGANIGCASRYWAILHPNTEIVAVEPEPDNFHLLEENLAVYAGRIQAVNGAVWPEKSVVYLDVGACNSASHRVGNGAANNRIAVQAYTIDELAAYTESKAFDLVKLDVEGAERELFSAVHTPAWLDKASVVVVELHEDYSPGAGKEMARAFATREFSLFLSGENLVWIRTSEVSRFRSGNWA